MSSLGWVERGTGPLLEALLARLAHATGAPLVWLLRATGEILARVGAPPAEGEAALAALAAGLFQSSRRLAGLLGGEEFSTRTACGPSHALTLVPVPPDALLLLLTGTDRPPTWVRSQALETGREVKAVLTRPRSEGEVLWEEEPFLREGGRRLERLLGGKTTGAPPGAAPPSGRVYTARPTSAAAPAARR